jgi:alpha-tubulin suppressor-like RCC1 family protein
VTEEGEVFSWGLGHFGAIGRSFAPFEYDADAAVVALGGEELGGENAAAVMVGGPNRDENFERPNAVRPEFDLAAHLDLINNLSLEDSSNQCYPCVIDSLQSVRCIGVSAGHRHSLVLDENGGVYSFGAGRTGCLGLGDNESQAFPVRISDFCKSPFE